MSLRDNILEQYQQSWQNFFNSQAENWLSMLRKKQFDQFLSSGFPSTRDEAWKYTPLTALSKQCFELIAPKKHEDTQAIQLNLLENEHFRLVFIDGHFQENLSRIPQNEKWLVTSLAQAMHDHEGLLQDYLFQQQTHSTFTHLNTACMQDGVFIYVPDNVAIKQPIHLLFLSSGNSVNSLQPIRNIFIFEENTQAILFEEHGSLSQKPYMANVYTQFYSGKHSNIDYIKLQNQNIKSFHFANLEIVQKRSSQVNANVYHLGGEIAREDIHAYLKEHEASLYLKGLYLPFNKQHIDLHTFVHHLADHTHSETLLRGVVASQSRGVFNGKILVGKDIKKAAANLQNKNLLLGQDAEINTKPELEIYSDDVQCKHGAAIGELDSQMLFYLRSRGISREEAYHLLLLAFIREQLNVTDNQVISEKLLTIINQHCEAVIR